MRIRAAILALLLLPLAGCELFDQLSDAVDDTEAVAPAPSYSPSTAREQLPALRVAERRPAGVPDYSRREFGTAWKDVDGNGCNQRDDVLLRDAVPGTTVVQVQRSCPHDVLAGTWVDPYSGAQLTFTDLKDQRQAQAIQIDHVVPLAEAWLSGAHAWPAERRERFANDLGVLLASDGPTNASKGSGDPAAWRPKGPFQCAYATHWIDVKHRWQLAVDRSEARALTEMLATCDPS
ncbi:HNH endonuclease [Aeromicrobium sp. zg-636]|uniref:HNH endonuclease n=1 Tax=Aeromicrobium senzhongii TaxID=2663859 RepID=A0A8I0EUJ2_9ACTN|nr:HNH endonuclease family protein [Aeromicrobium sp. 636]MBC9225612.1 HNH endonuclease [Aeromicrobium senzhongii]